MAVTTKGLCATIALLCVIVPIIVGHVMPTGTEERTVYETGNMVNITSDIVNESEIRYQEYISDFNNSLFMAYVPVEVTTTHTPIPFGRYWMLFSPNYPDGPSAAFNPVGELTLQNIIGDRTISELIPRHFDFDLNDGVGTFTFTYNSVQYVASDIWWIPDRSMFMASGEFGSMILHDNFPTSVMPSNEAYTVHIYSTEYAEEENEFINPSQGAYLSLEESFFGGYLMPVFSNGYKNARVGFNVENLQTTARSQTWTIYDDDSSTQITLSWGGSGWTVSNGTDSVLIGSFKQIYVDIDAKADEVRVSSLARAGFSENPYPRFIKTFTIPLAEPIDEVSMIQYSEAGDRLMRAVVYSADIPTGRQSYIIDASVDLAAYYPMESLYVELSSFAFYGDSVTLPVIGTVDVVDGRITFTDTSGEERTVRLRDSSMAATYDEETQRYTVNIDGYVFAENIEAADLNLTFNGKWLFTMTLAPVVPRTVEEYVFNFTTLNITMEEFAFIGLITSLLAFVGCALVGKRSGQKVISLLLISGLAFMVYLAMLL